MNILEEFWYGNLEPAEYDANTSKGYKEILQLIIEDAALCRYDGCRATIIRQDGGQLLCGDIVYIQA